MRPWESRNNWYFIYLADIGSLKSTITNVSENIKATIYVHLKHCGWFQVVLYCVIKFSTNIGHDFLCTTKTTILLTARGVIRNWDRHIKHLLFKFRVFFGNNVLSFTPCFQGRAVTGPLAVPPLQDLTLKTNILKNTQQVHTDMGPVSRMMFPSAS